MNAKIRTAQKQKIPYMLVVGDQEAEAGRVAPRLRSGEKLAPMSVSEFIAHARQEISDHV
jgi:threonyl-tRNA synthetase